MSDELTKAEVRNAAICLIAADAALCDSMSAEHAVQYARKIEASLDEPPWAGGKHAGDCTKQAHTCNRCFVEKAEHKARIMFEEEW